MGFATSDMVVRAKGGGGAHEHKTSTGWVFPGILPKTVNATAVLKTTAWEGLSLGVGYERGATCTHMPLDLNNSQPRKHKFLSNGVSIPSQ